VTGPANWYAAVAIQNGEEIVHGLWPAADLLSVFAPDDCKSVPVVVQMYSTDELPEPLALPQFCDMPLRSWAVCEKRSGIFLAVFSGLDTASDYCVPEWIVCPIVISVRRADGPHPSAGSGDALFHPKSPGAARALVSAGGE
jgi:hypothetical protein